MVPVTRESPNVLASLIAAGKHMEFVDALIKVLEPSLQALHEPIIEKVAERTGRFFPRYFNRKIAAAILHGLRGWLISVRSPASVACNCAQSALRRCARQA